MKKIRILMVLILMTLTILSVSASDLGDLVFHLDFENLTSASSGTVVGKTTEQFGSQDVKLYNAGSSTSVYGVATPSGASSKMLSAYVTEAGYHGYIRFLNFSLTKPGTYTLVYDVMVAGNVAYLNAAIDEEPSHVQNIVKYTAVTTKTVTRTFEETPNVDYVQIQFARNLGGISSAPVYVDNVRLYFKGAEVPEPDYGLLLASQDFEKSTSIDDKLLIKGTGSKVYGFGAGAEYSLEIPSGVAGATTMLRVKSTEKKSPAAGYTNMVITRPGTYTVTFDYYMPSDYTCSWFQVRGIKDVPISVVKGSLQSAVAQFRIEEGQSGKSIYIQAYNSGKVINNSYYIDNFKVYIQPDVYLFSDYAKNLVTTFIGDAKTQRGFAWTADKKCADMVVRFAKKSDGLANGYTEVKGYSEEYLDMLYYKADITGLASGTEYVYIVGDTEVGIWSDECTFVTEAENTGAFSFIAMTDPQGASASNYQGFANTINEAFERDEDAKFVATLGDMVELGYVESYWDMYFDAYDGICAEIPNMAVMGNHETREGVAGKNYRLHFNNPNNGHNALGTLTAADMTANYYKELVENIEETVYSFDYGDVHFAVLNTGSDWSTDNGRKLVGAQKAWLEADLEASDAKWKIVMMHQGLYPAKEERYWGLREIYEELFCDMEVDLVLQGHDHMVARTYPVLYGNAQITEDTDTVTKGEGIVYFIPGAAADKRYDDIAEKPSYMVKVINTAKNEPVYSVISVDTGSLTVETYDVTGEELDSFEIVKKNYFAVENKKVTVSTTVDRTGVAAPGFALVACYDGDGRIVKTVIRQLYSIVNDIDFEFTTDKTVADVKVITLGNFDLLQPAVPALSLERF